MNPTIDSDQISSLPLIVYEYIVPSIIFNCLSYLYLFTSGPTLPKPLQHHAMLSFGDDQVIIGGYSVNGGAQKYIYQISCYDRSCTVTMMTQKLYEGRAGHIAILVDDDLTDCYDSAVK